MAARQRLGPRADRRRAVAVPRDLIVRRERDLAYDPVAVAREATAGLVDRREVRVQRAPGLAREAAVVDHDVAARPDGPAQHRHALVVAAEHAEAGVDHDVVAARGPGHGDEVADLEPAARFDAEFARPRTRRVDERREQVDAAHLDSR